MREPETFKTYFCVHKFGNQSRVCFVEEDILKKVFK